MRLSSLSRRPLRGALASLSLLAACHETTAPAPMPPADAVVSGSWSTPLGGSGSDLARDAVVDASGNLFVVGGAGSNNFPSTPGTFNPVHNNSANGGAEPMDAFVTKFGPDGKILASTFVGGRSYDRAYAIELDPQGNVVIAGRAGAGFPVTPGAAQTTFAGGVAGGLYGSQDAFACKLTPDLARALWCTYLGSTGQDFARDLDVDPQGNVYVAGNTTGRFAQSAWFSGGYASAPAGGGDEFVMELNGTTGQVIWGTYLGGAGSDGINPSIRWSPSGPWTLSGTSSSKSPVTATGYQRSLKGTADMYLAHLTPDGSRLLYGTYVGGTGTETTETHDLGVNTATGDVYISGQTSSTNLPVTSGAMQRSAGGKFDGFLTRFSAGGALLYSSYLGSPQSDVVEGVLIGPDGTVYLSGQNLGSYSMQPRMGSGGGADGTLLTFAADGRTELFGRTVGGSGNDPGRGVAFSTSGALYIVGLTTSANFPRSGSYTRAYGGGASDGYVARLR